MTLQPGTWFNTGVRAKHLVREITDAEMVDIEKLTTRELLVESAAEYSLSEVSSRVDPKSASNKRKLRPPRSAFS